MKKIISKNLFSNEYKFLEIFSFILLLFWSISPLIEYYLLNYHRRSYTHYFVFSIYFIGIIGIITYFVYLYYLKKDGKLFLKNYIPEICIFILLILSIISSFLSSDIHLSLFGESYRKEGLIVYVMYIGFILLSSIIHNNKYRIALINSIISTGFIITILPFFQDHFTYYRYSNVFHQFNHYGYYLMILVIFTGYMFIYDTKRIKKILYLLLYVYFSYLLIRNNTFGCYLSILIGFIFLLIYSIIKKCYWKNILFIIIVFIITSFIVSYFDIKIGERVYYEKNQNIVSENFNRFGKDIDGIVKNNKKDIRRAGTGRGLLWKEALNYIKEHPIIGGGMECLGKYYQSKHIYYNSRPHNSILQIASFIGIPGAILYILLISYIGTVNLKIIYRDLSYMMIYNACICYFISSLFGNSMYYTSPYYMILLGLLIGMIRREK